MNRPDQNPINPIDELRLRKRLEAAVNGENQLLAMSTTLGMSMYLAIGMRLTKEQYLGLASQAWDQVVAAEPVRSSPVKNQ